MEPDILGVLTVGGLVLTVLAMVGGVIGLVWAILRAAQFEPQAMLVVVLGVLALISILGYFAGGEERSELVTLAATAIGALAGALTLLTTSKNGRRQNKEREEPSDGDSAGQGDVQGDGE